MTQVLGESDPLQRQWGTAATVAAAVGGGADIVRVHDVAEMAQVATMADAIHRSGGVACGSTSCGSASGPEGKVRYGDTIELGRIAFECIVGIREREQRALQPLEVDVSMTLPAALDHCARSGNLNGSVNYAAIAKQVAAPPPSPRSQGFPPSGALRLPRLPAC